MVTFKVLAALLTYPEQDMLDALPELEQALDADRLLGRESRRALGQLFAELRRGDLMALQENYVGLFDRVRSLSLHLFEHVHGESRDRGQAMVDLRELYAAHGCELATDELPDFLPAFLEFLSYRPLAEARPLLADAARIIENIGARLKKRASSYSAVFAALLDLSGEGDITASVIADEDIRREDDLALLDKVWQEEPVTFGPGAADARRDTAVVRIHRGGAK